jgi:hypothetical protein
MAEETPKEKFDRYTKQLKDELEKKSKEKDPNARPDPAPGKNPTAI